MDEVDVEMQADEDVEKWSVCGKCVWLIKTPKMA